MRLCGFKSRRPHLSPGGCGFCALLAAALAVNPTLKVIQVNPPEEQSQERGTVSAAYQVIHRGQWTAASARVIEEASVSVFVNGRELVTMMATPSQQEALAVGYLFTEGLIRDRSDVVSVSLAPNQTCVDVWLADQEFAPPQRRILTSGCGRGTTFDDASTQLPPLNSDVRLTPDQLAGMMGELQKNAQLYHRARGIHAAGLANSDRLVVMAEDVGRHNTFDKVAGRCLLDAIDPGDHILLTTGRISSEMVAKARRMGIPLVASLTSPTSLSVQHAERWNMTLVGYLRPERMQVYTHPERLR